MEAQIELSTPELVQAALHDVELAVSIVSQAFRECKLLIFTIELGSKVMVLCEKVWNLPVLFEEHHRIAGEFEPAGERILGDSLVSVQNKGSKAVNRTELVDVAPSDPKHLVNAFFLRPHDSFIDSILYLPGCKQLNMHAVEATESVPRTLI